MGISVSRVGGNAQIKAMKQVAGRLRLDLAQYRELEAFAEFGSELDKASQQQLARGARVVEVLKQPQYEPMPVEQQVISIYAVTGGYLDDVPLEDCKRFEPELLDFVATRHREIAEHIRDKGDLPEEIEAKLKEAIPAFKEIFAPSGGRPGSAAAIGAPHAARPGQARRRMGPDVVGGRGRGRDRADRVGAKLRLVRRRIRVSSRRRRSPRPWS